MVGCLDSEPRLALSQTGGYTTFFRPLGESAAPGGRGVRAVPRLCILYRDICIITEENHFSNIYSLRHLTAYGCLRTFAELQKKKKNYQLHVQPSVCLTAGKNSASIAMILCKLIFELFFLKICHENSISIKISQELTITSHEDTSYIFDHISLSSSNNEKCFRQNLYRKSKHTFCVQ